MHFNVINCFFIFYVNINCHVTESACLCIYVLFVLYIITYYIVIFCTLRIWGCSQPVSLDVYMSTLLLCFFFKYHNSLQIQLNWMPVQMAGFLLPLYLTFLFFLQTVFYIICVSRLCFDFENTIMVRDVQSWFPTLEGAMVTLQDITFTDTVCSILLQLSKIHCNYGKFFSSR